MIIVSPNDSEYFVILDSKLFSCWRPTKLFVVLIRLHARNEKLVGIIVALRNIGDAVSIYRAFVCYHEIVTRSEDWSTILNTSNGFSGIAN